MLEERIREELARHLAVEGQASAMRPPGLEIDLDLLRDQVRKLIVSKLGKAQPERPPIGDSEIDQALLEQAVREVVARKLGLSRPPRAAAEASAPTIAPDRTALEAQIRRLLAEKLMATRGERRRRGRPQRDPLGDRRLVEARMREAVTRFLRGLPPESASSLSDEDIDRLIDRALAM